MSFYFDPELYKDVANDILADIEKEDNAVSDIESCEPYDNLPSAKELVQTTLSARELRNQISYEISFAASLGCFSVRHDFAETDPAVIAAIKEELKQKGYSMMVSITGEYIISWDQAR